ncbi:MAG: GPR endopeptidase, partial [Defluviitaleaceae bacterium]|nr:GPR endopeptidase [Defluviitaleaceae bacterium]
RHIMDTLPDELAGGVLSVGAIAPSVMGLTGIETAEIVRGLVSHVKPTLIIAIDALAARSVNRINSVLQLTNTGISPGAGMGNTRMPLNRETLGVPVIAIGVPTVVDAATLVNDTLDMMLAEMNTHIPENLADSQGFFDTLRNLQNQEKYHAIRETLAPYDGNMFVTPKEIGEVVNWLANIIGNGINLSLHPGLDRDDINRFTY